MEASHKIPAWAEHRALIDYLSRLIVHESKTRLRRLIADGDITVNGNAVNSSVSLAKNDRVACPPGFRAVRPGPVDLNIEIVFEDADHLVVNKPPGVAVSHGHFCTEPSLYDWLLTALNRQAPEGGPYIRPHIVHRLDRETSGVLLVAKHAAAARYLSSQFQNRTVRKIYIGLVEGAFPQDRYRAVIPLKRESRRPMSKVIPDGENGKEAITEIEVVRRYTHFTLLRLYPHTGRQHQLRVHLMALGYPLIVDFLYGRREALRHSDLLKMVGDERDDRRDPDEVLLGRTPLHAESITYRPPDGGIERKQKAHRPPDFDRLMELLEGMHIEQQITDNQS